MKWYKPDDSEIIFEFIECKVGDIQGIIENYLELRNTFLLTIKNNESYRSIGVTKDKMLLKYLDETDILDLGWDKTSDSGHEYWSKSGDWFLTLTFDKVFIRKSFNDDMEVNVKNKQQLKLLMQFLGIAN